MGGEQVMYVNRQMRCAMLAMAVAGGWLHAQETPKYLDPKLPIEARLDDLIPRLTLEEKVKTLTDDWGSAAIPRLKIPSLLKTEGLHSQSYAKGSTVFPHAIAMAATFDLELIGRVGKETAVESKLAGIRQSWSPVLDVARDARWGRIEETYGEDPYLVSRMGVAWINGFQGEGMIATPKHFAVHGQPLGGRDSHDTELSDRAIREVHFPPFRAAMKEAKAGGLMAAYSTYHGVPCNASVELLRGVLEQEWGFKGIVVSDCGGPEQIMSKHSAVSSLTEAAVRSVVAGVNMECGSVFRKWLAPAVQEGLIEESALDEGVRRVLRAKMQLGLFENPPPARINMEFIEGYDTKERRGLAREVAVKSIVMLKNEGGVLPLRKDVSSIAVIGPLADEAMIGDYSPKTLPGQLVTVLAGVKGKVGVGTKVIYAKGCDAIKKEPQDFSEAVAAAKASAVTVLVVGDYLNTTGENHDGASLDFPGRQRELVKAVVEAAGGKPVVLVVVNGKPFTLAWEAEHVPAMLVSWYPGEEGGNATADLLFGDRNPSGRLPITFPRSVGQVPLTYDYKPSGRKYEYYDEVFAPLYRFGHGLSYTSFSYSGMETKVEGDKFLVSAEVTNTGERDGDEVVQLYVTDEVGSVSTPVMAMQGFERVSLKAGEKKRVSFTLTPYQLSLLDEGMHRVVEPGRFRVHVGGMSPEPAKGGEKHKQTVGFKEARFGVSGAFEVAKEYRARFEAKIEAPSDVKGGEKFPAKVTVANKGNLTDVVEVALYGDEKKLGTRRFELEPGESGSYTFEPVLYRSGGNLVSVVSSAGGMTGAGVQVSKVQPRVALGRVRMRVDGAGKLVVSSRGTNVGSDSLGGEMKLMVNGVAVGGEEFQLGAGEGREFSVAYQLPRSGTYKVQLGDSAAQQVTVVGAVTLALRAPMVSMRVGDGGVVNEVSGLAMKVVGKPTFESGPGGKGRAIRTASSDAFVNAEAVDLYRKPFTLAAWVKINSLGQRDSVALFGGKAPMGADQDQNGTVLHVGVRDKKLTMSFFGSTVNGTSEVPVGEWVHVAYTYDPATELGAVYLNGKLERRFGMKPYTGPLEMIGNAPIISHGDFAMADVVVLRTALGDGAVGELAKGGVEALRRGEGVTGWVSADASKVTGVEVSATGGAKVVVEIGDESGKVVDWVEVGKSGPVKLKGGSQLRLRVKLATEGWGEAPAVSAVELQGVKALWSFGEDWGKGAWSAGVEVEK